MANFGIGFGAFVGGLRQGMAMGQMLKDRFDQAEAEDTRRSAMDEAQKQRDAAVAAKTAALMGLGPQNAGETQQVAAPMATATPQGAPLDAVPTQAPAQVPAQVPAQAPAQVPTQPQLVKTGAGLEGVPPATPGTGAGVAALNPQANLAPRMAAVGLPAAGAPQQPPNIELEAPKGDTGFVAGAPGMSRKDAAAAAKDTVPSVLEFFQKSGVPRVAEMYLRQGNPEKAAAWEKWAEDQQTQKNVRTWAKAYRAVELGDWEKAGDHIMDLYGHYSDGITPLSKEIVKDKDGKVTGFNVKLKTDATGEERSTFVSTQDMATLGLTALSPPQMFEAVHKSAMAEAAARRTAQADVGKARLQLALENVRQGGRLALQDKKQEGALEQIDAKAGAAERTQRNKVQQELDAKVGALQKAGYSEDFIREALPGILGVGDYKKATSPEEARRLAFSDRMKNDPQFARAKPEKQRELIEQDMALITGGIKSPAKTTSSSGNASSSSSAAQARKGIPYLDNTTGKVVYR